MKKSKKAKNNNEASCFILDPATLLPGDIILEKGNALTSKIISAADRGFYSHAILSIGNGEVAEAVGNGVIFIPAKRIVTRQPRNFGVYRLPSGQINEDQIKILVATARNHAFSFYDTSGALATKVPLLSSRPDRQFCSRFIAECYAAASIDIVPGKQPDKITPNDIARPPSRLICLDTLSHFIRLPISSPEDLKDVIELEDRHSALRDSPLDKNRAIEQEAYNLFYPRVMESLALARSSLKPANLGNIINMLTDPMFPRGDEISDDLVAWLEGKNYFDLIYEITQNQDMPILLGALKRGDLSYAQHLIKTTIPIHYALIDRFNNEINKISNLEFSRSIHLRKKEMHQKNVKIIRDYCDFAEHVAKAIISKFYK